MAQTSVKHKRPDNNTRPNTGRKTKAMMTIEDVIKKLNFHPREGLAMIALGIDPSTGKPNETKFWDKNGVEHINYGFSDEVRITAIKELAQYTAPKRKAIEHSGSLNSEPFRFEIITDSDPRQNTQTVLDAETGAEIEAPKANITINLSAAMRPSPKQLPK